MSADCAAVGHDPHQVAVTSSRITLSLGTCCAKTTIVVIIIAKSVNKFRFIIIKFKGCDFF